MIQNFYDKVAKKFGNYSTPVKISREYTNGNPEDIFKEKLIEASGKDKAVLDVGCADGRFTISISSYFAKVIAIDTSKGMLESARKLQKKSNITNVSFLLKNLHNNDFKDKSFDVIYSRRGPTDYPEFFRLLKKGGYYIEIGIGEKDTQRLKEVFGRGQNYGDWNSPYLKKNIQEIEKAGLKVIFGEDYLYNEYYQSEKNLDIFLQGVPIFEDYDFKKDKNLLNKYVSENVTSKGVILSRHRIVIVAKKKLRYLE